VAQDLFVTEAARIAAAKLGLQKGGRDQKRFADQMVGDHTTNAELKGFESSGDVRLKCAVRSPRTEKGLRQTLLLNMAPSPLRD
jgi:predicted outer membrane protein